MSLLLTGQDVSEVKDPELFERLPGFEIYDHTVTNFGAYRFCDESGENVILEGQITYFYYECDGEVDPRKIVSKFSNAVEDAGGKVYGDDPNQKYMVYKQGNITTWVDLFAEDFYYTLNIIRKAELLSKVSAQDIIADLDEKGQAILYFNFDSKKCELKEECLEVVTMIAELVKGYPDSEFLVEAYTDDIGRSDQNRELSENRANVIVEKLIELGVAESSIEARGKGEEDPIADNKTVEGRSLNNRIVLKRK